MPHRLARMIWRRRLRRWATRMVVLGSAGLVLLILVIAAQVRATPWWWRTVAREDPATIALGQRIENSIINRANKIRPPEVAGGPWLSEPWTVELRPDEANAWLNVRLPKWVANQKDEFRWPKEVTDIQVDFGPGEIRVGATVTSGERKQVFTATLRPQLEDDGRLFMPATWVNVGRLPIPAALVLGHAHRNAADYIPPEFLKLPETEALFRAFEGDDALIQRAVVRLPDGRRVRILELSAAQGVLRITCRTEMQ